MHATSKGKRQAWVETLLAGQHSEDMLMNLPDPALYLYSVIMNVVRLLPNKIIAIVILPIQ